MDTSGLPLAKPEPRKRVKARRDRHEAAVVGDVRERVAARDGFCRAQGRGLGPCRGRSEWAHYGQWRRSKTVHRPPEDRHCTAGSLMLCTAHHGAYDRGEGGRLVIDALGETGCNGPLRLARNGVTYEEAA